jgi:hypothetical protein
MDWNLSPCVEKMTRPKRREKHREKRDLKKGHSTKTKTELSKTVAN